MPYRIKLVKKISINPSLEKPGFKCICFKAGHYITTRDW